MNDVAPLLQAEAIRLLEANCTGSDRPVVRLLDPEAAAVPVGDAAARARGAVLVLTGTTAE